MFLGSVNVLLSNLEQAHACVTYTVQVYIVFPVCRPYRAQSWTLDYDSTALILWNWHWSVIYERYFCLQRTVESLKAENDQLKTGGTSPTPSPGPSCSVSQSSGLTTLGGSSPRQSVAMHMPKSYSRGLSEGTGNAVLPLPNNMV